MTDLSQRRHSSGIPILLYHSISDRTPESSFRSQVTPSDLFRRQMHSIAERGLRGVALSELMTEHGAGRPLEGLIGLTFDDAYSDFLSHALPVLQSLGFSSTLFVPTAHVGQTASWVSGKDGDRRLLGWEGLAEAVAAGVELGSHGHRHVPMDELSAMRMLDELVTSRELLRRHLCVAADTLAYPHGYASRVLMRQARAAGFRWGCVIGHRPWTPGQSALAINRVLVGRGSTSRDLTTPSGRARMRGRAARVGAVPWRALRRHRHLVTGRRQPGTSWAGSPRQTSTGNQI